MAQSDRLLIWGCTECVDAYCNRLSLSSGGKDPVKIKFAGIDFIWLQSLGAWRYSVLWRYR